MSMQYDIFDERAWFLLVLQRALLLHSKKGISRYFRSVVFSVYVKTRYCFMGMCIKIQLF